MLVSSKFPHACSIIVSAADKNSAIGDRAQRDTRVIAILATTPDEFVALPSVGQPVTQLRILYVISIVSCQLLHGLFRIEYGLSSYLHVLFDMM